MYLNIIRMFQIVVQSVSVSFKALLANKTRSFLTMLGIIIGVGSVIVIMSVGAGAQSLILNQIETLGSDLIGVLPGKSEEGPPASAYGIVITTLTYEDALALGKKSNVPNISEVAAFYRGSYSVKYGVNSYDTTVNGTTANYFDVEGGGIAEGRFFNQDEEKNLSKVAILGYTVKQELFGDSNAVGQKIKIKNQAFEVIGVSEERGVVALVDYDDQVIIPIKTMQKILEGVNHITMIRAKVDDENNVERAISDVENTLRERHGIDDPSGDSDDFTVRGVAEALEIITTITNALKFFLASMAALSLVVGGVGIMNIMLITVTERTREIGLRKAVGASSLNILRQFLLESTVITMFGGIIGLIGGGLTSYLIAVVANYLGYNWDFVLSFISIVLAIGVSTIIGIIFGIYPASKASKLEPVEALRYE